MKAVEKIKAWISARVFSLAELRIAEITGALYGVQDRKIDDLRSDLNDLRSDLNDLRSDLNKLRSDLDDLESDLQDDIRDIKYDLDDLDIPDEIDMDMLSKDIVSEIQNWIREALS